MARKLRTSLSGPEPGSDPPNRHPAEPQGSDIMKMFILWLLGVPLSLLIVLKLFGVL
ncbi:hypothetical protein [Chitinimonas koreensis]|uniref:hypothetical protein n=1 Tax=Chitinimonas koreensis TaxID=356302 RepID=UPI0012FC988C|nr:hypothetical protein [Chitinimonas koreensis]QNM97874.1 hypothetical protein H9L41_06305 [Chitinimonas koreensis]